ncbi:MAG: hypothetical protein H7319_12580 [Spirosoma sp.]|nr:hypothetical protein [Spirosoma sp.]
MSIQDSYTELRFIVFAVVVVAMLPTVICSAPSERYAVLSTNAMLGSIWLLTRQPVASSGPALLTPNC